MRPKNPSFIEKYVEKIVLAVGVLFLLFVAGRYFLVDPYRVPIQGQNLRPPEVEQRLAAEAQRLESRISDPANPLPPIPIPNYIEDFRNRSTRPSVPVAHFDVPLGRPGLDVNLLRTRDGRHLMAYHVPMPPGPADTVARDGYAVLGEPPPDQRNFYEQLIGSHRPRDFRWVTVSATFSFEQWRQRLRQRPMDANAQAMPEEWWRNKMLVSHVALERQARDPLTGQWGEVEVLPTLPNRQVAYPPTRRTYAMAEAQQTLQRIQLEQNAIAKPPFVPLAGGLWVPPGDAALAHLTVAEIHQLQTLEQEVARLERELFMLEAGIDDPDMDPAASGQVAPVTGRVVRLQQEQLEARLREKRTELAQLRGAPLPDPMVGAGSMPGAEAEVFQRDTITVWDHDISARPGMEYRYRLRVWVLNPLFQRSQPPREQQEEHYHQLALMSEAGQWSEPIRVEPSHYFFLVNSNQQQQTAVMEVYTIFNAQWQVNSFDVRPGDAIGDFVRLTANQVEFNVDMRTDAVLVDVDFGYPVSGPGVARSTTRAVIWQESSKSLHDRTIAADREHDARIRLQNLMRSGRMAVGMAP